MSDQVIPHSRPTLTDSDIEAVIRVLRSGQLSSGPVVSEFERKFAEYIGQHHAAATSSGTSALHLALLALGVGKGDEVIIPSFVCSALLNAVNTTQATPVIVDIDPQTFNLSVDTVKSSISRKTKAVIVPHMFGLMAEMEQLAEFGVPLIEDCAQSAGAVQQGQKAGSFGLLSVFSFYATKVLTSAEGGMVVSDSRRLISKVKDLRDYDDKDNYVLRFNYKMSDVQAALGVSQLASLEGFINKRKEIAARYFEEFKDCDFALPTRKEGREHIYYRFIIKTKREAFSCLEEFKEKKVICRRPVYRPLHLYSGLRGFANTMEAWTKTVSIPIYPSLTEEEIKKIIAVVREIF